MRRFLGSFTKSFSAFSLHLETKRRIGNLGVSIRLLEFGLVVACNVTSPNYLVEIE